MLNTDADRQKAIRDAADRVDELERGITLLQQMLDAAKNQLEMARTEYQNLLLFFNQN